MVLSPPALTSIVQKGSVVQSADCVEQPDVAVRRCYRVKSGLLL